MSQPTSTSTNAPLISDTTVHFGVDFKWLYDFLGLSPSHRISNLSHHADEIESNLQSLKGKIDSIDCRVGESCKAIRQATQQNDLIMGEFTHRLQIRRKLFLFHQGNSQMKPEHVEIRRLLPHAKVSSQGH